MQFDTRIDVVDKEVCGDLGLAGAHCKNTLTAKRRDIPKPAWDQERVGMLCMKSSGFTDTENAIKTFCNAYDLCDYKTTEALRKVFDSIREVKAKADRAKGAIR